jgi:hypothetical protein
MFIIGFFLWLAWSSIALAADAASIAQPTLEQCLSAAGSWTFTGVSIPLIWALLIALSTVLSRCSGWIVTRFGTKAGTVIQSILWLVKLFGYLTGKVGWGEAKTEELKTFPKRRKKKDEKPVG